MLAMRAWLVVVLAVLSACGQKRPARPAGDGELVIEVGGPHRSLRSSLRSLGVELLPGSPLRASAADPVGAARSQPVPATLGPQASAPGGPARQQLDQPQDPPASAGRGEAPRSPPRGFEVRLGAGQTVMDLARIHLGSDRRYAEILQLNGWTEDAARRLRIGQPVRIPGAAPTDR